TQVRGGLLDCLGEIKILLALETINLNTGADSKASCSTALRIFIRGMGGLLARSCRNRNGANERDSSTKESIKSLGMLAQTFGKPVVSTARHGARTLWGRLFSRTWENMPPKQTSAGRASGGTGGWKTNLNHKANGLALQGPSVGLYVPLLEFNQ